MSEAMRPIVQTFLFWSLVTMVVLVLSIRPSSAQEDLFNEFDKLDDTALEGQRGGFVTESGFNVSVGLERITAINGQVIHAVKLDLGDLSTLTARGLSAAGLNLNPAATAIIQNGPGNTVTSDVLQNLSNGAVATVVQNSLDNQQLQNITVINTTVTGMQTFRNMNVFGDLQLNLRGN